MRSKVKENGKPSCISPSISFWNSQLCVIWPWEKQNLLNSLICIPGQGSHRRALYKWAACKSQATRLIWNPTIVNEFMFGVKCRWFGPFHTCVNFMTKKPPMVLENTSPLSTRRWTLPSRRPSCSGVRTRCDGQVTQEHCLTVLTVPSPVVFNI